MSPASSEREDSFRMSISPAQHTRLVKEALALPSMLGVYWRGEAGREGSNSRKGGSS